MQKLSKKYWAKSYPITDYKRYAFANSGAVRLRHISYSRNVIGNFCIFFEVTDIHVLF
jgi:hypothetical protein